MAELEELRELGRSESLLVKRIRRFRRHKLAMFGLIMLSLLVVSAVFAPWLSRFSYQQLDLANRYSPPSATHWMGSDGTGRDIWARLLHGGRVSLSVGLVAVSISTGIGIILGGLAGYLRGGVDAAIMRLTDMVMCFPPLIVIIVLVAALGPSIYNTMAAIGLLAWPGIARLVRGSFLSLRETEFVQAARSIGASPARIIFKHILPNALGPVIVAATLGVASAILMEAGLSFLGLGVPPPTPSWGNMLNQAQNLILVQGMPWLWIPAGLAIILSVLSINFVGDGLRDAFDPRQLV
ncbi:MAG: ABC transporter permease [Chloroflexi bacterium]|nr:ABC transporter permease [Chloroflexota bacterium]